MFEKEAEEYLKKDGTKAEQILNMLNEISPLKINIKQLPFVLAMLQQVYQDGAEFGYNKANEWHDIKEIEPSKEQFGKQLLIKIESVTGDTDYDYFVYKYNGESMSDVIGVIAWKEIVLPELPKESE